MRLLSHSFLHSQKSAAKELRHRVLIALDMFHQQLRQAVQEEIGEYLDQQDLILDGGPSSVGVESTIIDCTSDAPRILRPGAITIEMIEESTGLKVSLRKQIFELAAHSKTITPQMQQLI
jgi:hypothetical protein